MNIPETLFDESIRTEEILWVSGQTDQPTDSFEEWFEDHDTPEELAKIFLLEPADCPFFEDVTDAQTLLSALHERGKTGFLVRAATPVPYAFHAGGWSHHGFGHCQMQWFYTDAFDEAFVERLLAWKATVVAAARQRLSKTAPRQA